MSGRLDLHMGMKMNGCGNDENWNAKVTLEVSAAVPTQSDRHHHLLKSLVSLPAAAAAPFFSFSRFRKSLAGILPFSSF